MNNISSRCKASFLMTRAAWRLLKMDSALLFLPLLNLVANVGLFLLMAGVAWLIQQSSHINFFDPGDSYSHPVYYAIMIAYLFASYCMFNFFNGAITYSAFRHFEGQTVTRRQALQASWHKRLVLAKFSLLQSTVGMLFNLVLDRVPLAGSLAVWGAGATWGIANTFSIPVIMSGRQTRPLQVVRASAQTFTQVWGEQVFIGLNVGILSIIALFAALAVASMLVAVALALTSLNIALGAVLIFIALLIIATVSISALQTITVAACYHYATTQQLPGGYDNELLRSAFRPKKAWLV